MKTPLFRTPRYVGILENMAMIASAVAIVFGSVAAAQGQIITTLHSFTNGDGSTPAADLLLYSNTLYGTTFYGGSSTNGTIFKVNPDGTGFQSLYNFVTSNGVNPAAGLIFSNSTFYGTASAGGNSNNGTIYSVSNNGSGFTVLHYFNGTDGKEPLSRLVMGTNGTLYGTTYFGGTNNKGTVFSINGNGTGFTTLHQFSGTDGEYPAAGLVLQSNFLYGTTAGDFSTKPGTFFKIGVSGSSFSTLGTFARDDGFDAEPLLSGNELYAPTEGGTHWAGSIADITTSGGGISWVDLTNSVGTAPESDLILVEGSLFGAASKGGSLSNGTVYAYNLANGESSSVWDFTGQTDGKTPIAGLLQSNQTLYGTASAAGQSGGSGYGTVFALEIGCPAWDWWKGDSNTVDSAGTNNGTTVGTVNYKPGYSCFGFSFPVTNSYVNFGTNAGNFGTNNFQIDLWVQTTSSNKQEILSKQASCGNANMWNLQMNSNGTVVFQICQDSTGTDFASMTSAGKINDGQLHEITVVRETTNLWLYLNGYFATNTSSTGIANIANNLDLLAGSGPCVGSTGVSTFLGLLDEIKLMPVCSCIASTWDLWKGESNVVDSIGANNGIISGPVSYTNGATDCSGHAFHFAGSTNYIDFGTNAGNFGSTNFMVDFWLSTTNTTQLQGLLGKRPVCNLCNSWDLRLEASGVLAFAICQDTSGTDHTTFTSQKTVNDGFWHEVTLIRRGAVVALYIDSDLDSQANTGGIVSVANSAHLYAGRSACSGTGGDGTEYFSGSLDEIKLMEVCE